MSFSVKGREREKESSAYRALCDGDAPDCVRELRVFEALDLWEGVGSPALGECPLPARVVGQVKQRPPTDGPDGLLDRRVVPAECHGHNVSNVNRPHSAGTKEFNQRPMVGIGAGNSRCSRQQQQGEI